jgi:signal transduction histidine kinase
LSSTDLLAQYSSKWSEERKQKHFQRIQSAVQYLTRLVNDVLFVNHAEVGSLEFKPVPLDLEEVTRNLVEEFELNAAGEHTIIFECQGVSTNVLLDEELLQSMLRNLLSNAIKYSPKASTVQFELVFQPHAVVFRYLIKELAFHLMTEVNYLMHFSEEVMSVRLLELDSD